MHMERSPVVTYLYVLVLTIAWIITFQARNYKTIQQILYRMNRMCVQAGFGGSLKPRKHEQRLLRNMGVHKVRASLSHNPSPGWYMDCY